MFCKITNIPMGFLGTIIKFCCRQYSCLCITKIGIANGLTNPLQIFLASILLNGQHLYIFFKPKEHKIHTRLNIVNDHCI